MCRILRRVNIELIFLFMNNFKSRFGNFLPMLDNSVIAHSEIFRYVSVKWKWFHVNHDFISGVEYVFLVQNCLNYGTFLWYWKYNSTVYWISVRLLYLLYIRIECYFGQYRLEERIFIVLKNSALRDGWKFGKDNSYLKEVKFRRYWNDFRRCLH